MANEHLLNDLSNEERETHLNMVADNRDEWIVFSDDPVMIRKLDKIAECIEARGGGKHYRLHRSQITLRKKKVITDEQRKTMAENARKRFHAPPSCPNYISYNFHQVISTK